MKCKYCKKELFLYFLNNLLYQARYENAMLTREDILKRIKNLTNDIEKIKKSITN